MSILVRRFLVVVICGLLSCKLALPARECLLAITARRSRMLSPHGVLDNKQTKKGNWMYRKRRVSLMSTRFHMTRFSSPSFSVWCTVRKVWLSNVTSLMCSLPLSSFFRFIFILSLHFRHRLLSIFLFLSKLHK